MTRKELMGNSYVDIFAYIGGGVKTRNIFYLGVFRALRCDNIIFNTKL